MTDDASPTPLQLEVERLRVRLAEAEQTLDAIRGGEVDSLVVEGPDGLRVYALEGASNSYRVLIEAMNEGAATLSETGVVLYSNSRFARMLDKPLHRFMGSSIHEHVADSSRATLEAMLRASEHEESRGEVCLVGADGEEVPAYLSVNAIYGDGGRVLCMVAVDLRAQKRNEEILAAERLAASVLMQAAEAIVVCDERGRIIRASATAAELCGRNPLLMRFEDAFPTVVRGSGAPHGRHSSNGHDGGVIEAVLRGATFRAAPATLCRESGEPAELLLSAAPLHGADADAIGCVVTLVDVTEHRRAEQALQRSEARLREADRRKNEFLAVLSHELRNPLATITTALQIIERISPSHAATRPHEVISRQVHQLARLVDDLLDLTRIARGKIELKRARLDLGDLLARTAEDYRPFFAQSGVRFELELPAEKLYVEADATRLAQVLGNLLHNASKFAGRGDTAFASLEREADESRAVIRIVDTGPGIAPEVLPRLFEPFAQADATLDRSQGGLGLGLALVKWLVQMHGGEISVLSEPGRGAEFRITLPLVEVACEQIFDPEHRSRAQRRRILIIEDNVDAAMSLRDVLVFDHHEVEVAHSGTEGLEKAHEFHPEVVLCDIGLPGMDGYEVARAIRANATLRSTYLVAITGYAMQEDFARATRAGFDWHIAKPAQPEELERILATLPRHGPRDDFAAPVYD